MNRRELLHGAAASAATLAWPARASGASSPLDPVLAQVEKHHDESVKRLQEWIRQPSIAAENRGISEGCDLMMRLLRTRDSAARTRFPPTASPASSPRSTPALRAPSASTSCTTSSRSIPAEWSSPPLDGRARRQARVRQGASWAAAPSTRRVREAAFLAALHAIRAAGRKLPVNLVLVAEGEEEIGSPHFPQIVRRPEVQAALAKCTGHLHALGGAGTRRRRHHHPRRQGRVELELVSSGEHWGRGPTKDVHSSNKARVDSPAWHLVQALATLVSADGNEPAIDGFADKARPLSAAEKAMIADAARSA